MTTPTHAASHVTAGLLAAAWRENLDGIRDRAHIDTEHPPHATIHIDTPTGRLTTTTETGPFDQITPTGPITLDNTVITDPTRLLHALTTNIPDHLNAELNDAVAGLTTALPRHHHRTTTITATARHHHATTTIALAQTLTDTEPDFLACRFFEPLAVDGHHLHPCARTRLGWTTTDRHAYDLETTQPIGMRFIAARRHTITSSPDHHGNDLGNLLEQLHPPLRDHHDPDTITIAVHPWQQHHLHNGPARDLYRDGTLRDLPTHLDAHPTASIRTLVTGNGTYLKCSLSIHITSTTRGISPATVHNGPILSRLLHHIITTDPYLTPRLAFLTEPAGAALPHGHPAARDLSCLLRTPLTDVTTDGELAVPATALPATSPLTGTSIATELLTHSGLTPTDFLHRYTLALAGPTIHLAANHGIGTEAHLQNCVPTFKEGIPHRVILRDLGGGRLHLPHLHQAGHHPNLHPASVITTTDPDTVRAKVAYTVFQNHLAAITTALTRDTGLPPTTAWRTIAETIDTLPMPGPDRDFYTAATVPHKALLSMRLHPGHDIHVPVTNPLARTPKP